MASLQQVVEQLVLQSAAGTTGPNTTVTASAPRGPLELATSIVTILFSASALRDWAILLLIGSFFEVARRSLASLWHALVNACFITAVFDECDDSYRTLFRVWLLIHAC